VCAEPSPPGHSILDLLAIQGSYPYALDGKENFPLEVEKFADAKGKASNLWQAVEASDIPAYYLWQIQNQLVVSGTTWACLDVSDGKEGIFLEVSKFVDTEARIDAAWEAF
jgi:predicted phage-related endonuclease